MERNLISLKIFSFYPAGAVQKRFPFIFNAPPAALATVQSALPGTG